MSFFRLEENDNIGVPVGGNDGNTEDIRSGQIIKKAHQVENVGAVNEIQQKEDVRKRTVTSCPISPEQRPDTRNTVKTSIARNQENISTKNEMLLLFCRNPENYFKNIATGSTTKNKNKNENVKLLADVPLPSEFVAPTKNVAGNAENKNVNIIKSKKSRNRNKNKNRNLVSNKSLPNESLATKPENVIGSRNSGNSTTEYNMLMKPLVPAKLPSNLLLTDPMVSIAKTTENVSTGIENLLVPRVPLRIPENFSTKNELLLLSSGKPENFFKNVATESITKKKNDNRNIKLLADVPLPCETKNVAGNRENKNINKNKSKKSRNRNKNKNRNMDSNKSLSNKLVATKPENFILKNVIGSRNSENSSSEYNMFLQPLVPCRLPSNILLTDPMGFIARTPGNFSTRIENLLLPRVSLPSNKSLCDSSRSFSSNPKNASAKNVARNPENASMTNELLLPGKLIANKSLPVPNGSLARNPENYRTSNPNFDYWINNSKNTYWTNNQSNAYWTNNPKNCWMKNPGNSSTENPDDVRTKNPSQFSTKSQENAGIENKMSLQLPEEPNQKIKTKNLQKRKSKAKNPKNSWMKNPGNASSEDPKNVWKKNPGNSSTENPEDVTTKNPSHSSNKSRGNASTEIKMSLQLPEESNQKIKTKNLQKSKSKAKNQNKIKNKSNQSHKTKQEQRSEPQRVYSLAEREAQLIIERQILKDTIFNILFHYPERKKVIEIESANNVTRMKKKNKKSQYGKRPFSICNFRARRIFRRKKPLYAYCPDYTPSKRAGLRLHPFWVEYEDWHHTLQDRTRFRRCRNRRVRYVINRTV